MASIERWTDNEHLLNEFGLWFENTEKIYGVAEWCAIAMAKKWSQNKPVELEYLKGTSTVAKIVTETMKLVGGSISREQRAMLKADVADRIWYMYEEERDNNEEYAKKREAKIRKEARNG